MKFDLHIHSAYSDDSDITPKDIIKIAETKDLDGIAFLDHNTLDGYLKSKYLDTDLIIVPAMEVSTKQGHIMALGVQEEIEDRLSIEETIDRVEERSGLAIAVHPFRTASGLGEINIRQNNWDAIEGMNGRCKEANNKKSRDLAADLDLPVTGGSDAHRLEDVGKAFTIFENVEDWEDVIREVSRGNTEVGGESRTFCDYIFYLRRTFFRWIKRGFKKI
ncbi:MAG: PHP domain-containing protein [Candidatus Thermoplasmatota archaeon]|nr:PHP domain-containing protein [Candidatus Thermoplasmatota archaeon]MBS3790074.1 PHP domain-containing protein [Candidatus Thermoplasmatota archaeon]